MESNQDVFISHSSADSKLASAMCDYLEQKGVRCWIAPRDVQGGTEYAEAIIMGIRNCKIMVVLFNKNANDSIYVKNEVERAFNYKSILIPFKVDQTTLSATLELFLGSVHSLDATKGSPEDHFDLLYKNCERVLEKKERVIEEKPVLPLTNETIESPVKELPLQHKEENNSQDNKKKESKKKKRVALLSLGSLTVLALIFIFIRNNFVPRKPVVKPTIQWVSIPEGTFRMGGTQANAAPKHEVRLSAFKMSAHEVTFAQYDVFCEDKNREKPSDKGLGRGQRPVINVSYFDAIAFAKWMGCRLPTEAEWEYACRAGSTADFNTGKKPTNTQANYKTKPTRARITAVGSFAANAWGLYDMHGNAWEWCSDWFRNYPSSPQTNPIGPSEGEYRIYRGGSWKSEWHSCRAWYRNKSAPGYSDNSIGFRLVSLK